MTTQRLRQRRRVDPERVRRALAELAALKDHMGDTSWADALPEPQEWPDDGDAVTAVFIGRR